MVDSRLRTVIRKKYRTDNEFAKAMGWTKQKVSKTLKGQRSPKISDLNAMSEALELPIGEVVSFFN